MSPCPLIPIKQLVRINFKVCTIKWEVPTSRDVMHPRKNLWEKMKEKIVKRLLELFYLTFFLVYTSNSFWKWDYFFILFFYCVRLNYIHKRTLPSINIATKRIIKNVKTIYVNKKSDALLLNKIFCRIQWKWSKKVNLTLTYRVTSLFKGTLIKRMNII